jgi:hypothetical protein
MKKIFTLMIAAVAAVSCVDMLNISPVDQISSGNMWTTESLVDKGMSGLYVNFYNNKSIDRVQIRHESFGGINRWGWMGMSVAANYLGDNSSPFPMLWSENKTADYFLIWYEWKWAYTSIHQINDAIKNLPASPVSEAKKARYLAEAKFLRAWFYARLNRIFGGSAYSSRLHGQTLETTLSVPLYLEVISEKECIKTQSTAKQVWDAVIADCNDCIACADMPDNTLSSNYGRPSKGAAYALRGMAYLYLEDYRQAISDFEKVKECGYDFWKGEYIDMFHHKNEKNSEMIFTIQFEEAKGYCDNIQLAIGGRDSWNSWSNLRPASGFVDYFQNADGSKFDWSKVPGLEDWNKLTAVQREVFFLRDGIKSGINPVTGKAYTASMKGTFNERIAKIGQATFDKYYIDNGNEARIKAAYADRDPRLKAICLVPYDPYDTFKDLSDNGGKVQKGKELRWPFISELEGDDRGDYYLGDNQSMYVFKKFSYSQPEDLLDRLQGPTDWPLIRYTDVALLLAEAYVEDNQLQKAADIVNQIRSRAHMPAISTGSQQEMREAVRYERRIELSLECHNFFDEWRWGTYKDSKFLGDTVYGDSAWWGEWDGYREKWYYNDIMYPWPAPAQECRRNENLARTAGWSY